MSDQSVTRESGVEYPFPGSIRRRFAGGVAKVPENRRQAELSRWLAVSAYECDNDSVETSTEWADPGSLQEHAGGTERQTLGFRKGQT